MLNKELAAIKIALQSIFEATKLKEFDNLQIESDNLNLIELSFIKSQILKSKTEKIGNQTETEVVALCDPTNLENLSDAFWGKFKLSKYPSINAFTAESKKPRSNSSRVIYATNNVVAKTGIDYFLFHRETYPNDLILIQDYDNHHWFQMSVQCLVIADVYAPAHSRLPPLFQQLLHHPFQKFPIGSIQWTRTTLSQNNSKIFQENRQFKILGYHSFYPRFPYRNKVISTFNAAFSEVGFIDSHRDFHGLSELDRLSDWTSSALHLIVPVADDIPIRFFDALITGGLPIVPMHITDRLASIGIPREMYEVYGPYEILNPLESVDRWHNLFTNKGDLGILERHSFAMRNWHTDEVALRILNHFL